MVADSSTMTQFTPGYCRGVRAAQSSQQSGKLQSLFWTQKGNALKSELTAIIVMFGPLCYRLKDCWRQLLEETWRSKPNAVLQRVKRLTAFIEI